ncbi:putative pentatricopeptide repeat-containing protein, partial [Corchorus capsularis]
VPFLIPLSFSLHSFSSSLPTSPSSSTEPDSSSETHYKQLIFNTIEEKPWAFCNTNW